MPRIPYADPATLSPAVLASIASKPANVSRVLTLTSEPVYHALSGLLLAMLNDTALPPKLREIAILRVGYLSGSTYELFQHEPLGLRVGLSEAQLAAIRDGDASSPLFDATERDVLRFVDDLVPNARPSDASLAAVRRHLNDRQTMDLTVLVGAYMMACRVFETSGVEIETTALDWIDAPG